MTTDEASGYATEVEYTCQSGYALYPESQNSVINCVNGAWDSTSNISCLKSMLMLFNIKTSYTHKCQFKSQTKLVLFITLIAKLLFFFYFFKVHNTFEI